MNQYQVANMICIVKCVILATTSKFNYFYILIYYTLFIIRIHLQFHLLLDTLDTVNVVCIMFIFLITFLFYIQCNISDQHTWVQNFKLCDGKLQSPISISSFKSITLPLPALEIIGYHDFLSTPLYLKNNGHSGIMIEFNCKIILDNISFFFSCNKCK